MKDIKIENRKIDLKDYIKLRKEGGWRDTDEVVTKEGLENSLYSVVAIEGDKTVGIGRIIDDGGLYFYIQDLIVHPKYHGKGLGRKIMTELLKYINRYAGKGPFIGLMAAKGLEGYYKEFGFESWPEDGPGMYPVK